MYFLCIQYEDAFRNFTLWKEIVGGGSSNEAYVKSDSKIYFWETN
jgi:hypothetical protein